MLVKKRVREPTLLEFVNVKKCKLNKASWKDCIHYVVLGFPISGSVREFSEFNSALTVIELGKFCERAI